MSKTQLNMFQCRSFTKQPNKTPDYSVFTKHEADKYKEKVNKIDPKYYTIKKSFSYLEPHAIKIISQIGRGGYGTVYKGIGLEDPVFRPEYAIKINFSTVATEVIYIEGAILSLCTNKRNLPRLINIFVAQNQAHIVTEYFQHTPFIKFFMNMNIHDVKHYILQLLLGIKSLKEIGIYHRDIKPGNFLYNVQKKTGVIIDFGLAETDNSLVSVLNYQKQHLKEINDSKGSRKIEESINLYQKISSCLKVINRNKIGTETYMPIESMLFAQDQSYSSDIWPVGVIFLQILSRKYHVFNKIKNQQLGNSSNTTLMYYLIELATLLGAENVVEQCKKLKYHLKLPEGIQKVQISKLIQVQGFDDVAKDLLMRMLDLDAFKRITVDEAISHPFFDSVRTRHLNCNDKKK